MYSTFVATAVEKYHFNDGQCPLIMQAQDELVIFCPHDCAEIARQERQKYDPNSSKTFYIYFERTTTDAWHLYSNNLASINNTEQYQTCNKLLVYNRMAFVRDYFSKNHFKKSHVLWVDADSPVLEFVDFTKPLFNNLNVCRESQVLFRNELNEFIPSMFILPQEMGWNFYYLTKLIYKDSLYHNKQEEFSEYFKTFSERHPEQTTMVDGDLKTIAALLQENGEEVLPPKFETDKKLVVVVNHYQHDTSWVNRLYHPVVVYNKNPADTDKYELNLPNVGFDTIVYFRFIIDNYDNLPDYMCFLQDDPFFHCMDTIQIVNNFKFDRDFVPMSTSYHLGGHDWKMSEDYADRVGLAYQRPLKMITSCQVIISKEKVLQRSKEFYELLVSTIDKHVKSSENYAIENLWPTILGFNEELQPCWNCKGYGDKQ
jgi:hypothetical protein